MGGTDDVEGGERDHDVVAGILMSLHHMGDENVSAGSSATGGGNSTSENSSEARTDSTAASSERVTEVTRRARGEAIERYRQKRLRRQYGKRIRYQSRKNIARTRPRVKGRFVKTD
mmetsp:Transcript_2951/g.9034  ORF Transcript_2951/g.9034 Transcript_2951/m.9034 type:complete len:116 (-) Transcript_2951:199-546(-)